MRLFKIFRNEKYGRLVENFFSLSFLQGANYLLPLITLPYLVRVFGAEGYGQVMFAYSFIQYFVILTDYGFNLSATRSISVNRENSSKISEIVCSVLTVKTIFLVIGFGIMCGVVFSVPQFRTDWKLFLLTYGIVVGQVYFPVWFFQGMEKMKYITLLNITARLIFTIFIFVLIQNKSDYLYFPILYSIGYITAGILSLYIIFVKFRVKIVWPSFGTIYSYFKESTQFFLSRASVSIYTASNTIVLGLFAGPVAVGYYASAEQLYKGLQGLIFPLNNALYPYIAKEKNVVLFKKIMTWAVMIMLVITVFVFMFSELITSLVFGDGFEPTSDLLKLFAPLALIVIISVLLGYPFLAALGHAKYANYSVIAGAICHIIMLLITIPILSIYSVAIITIITETIVLSVRIYGVKKHGLWKQA
ncbi:MAG: flippase [candidate division Zixibacteria bacterium]|nr:flippase [candidate division Zixibacteria bacterium]